MTANSSSPSTLSYTGRPSDITAVSADLLDYIRQGLIDKDAANLVGIDPRTLQRWVSRGKGEVERVGENPRASVRKKEKVYADFLLQYNQACAERKQALVNTATLVAMGHYRIIEETHTTITKNGQTVQEMKVIKEKEVGPDGNLALKLLAREERRDADGEEDKQKDDPRLQVLGQILQLSPAELEALNENLEASAA